MSFALALVFVLVGAGAAFLVLMLHPEWSGVVSAFRGQPDPRTLQGLALVVLTAASVMGFSFWQGTQHARLSCVQVDRVADALAGVNLSVQVWARNVGQLSDGLDALRSTIRVRPGATGGP